MSKRKIAEYKYTDREIREIVKKEFHIEKEIRKDRKEEMEYIIEEIETIRDIPKHQITEYDKIRYEMFMSLI